MALPPPPKGSVAIPPPPPGSTAVSGGTSDPPPTDEGTSEAEAFEQGAIFDPIEAIGQMLPPRVSSAIGSVIPESVKRYAGESAAGAEAHPGWRLAGNVAPWLFVPGAGESVLGDIAMGAGSALLQPVAPDTQNFWTEKGLQAGLGGATAGTLGRVAKGISDRLAAAARVQKQFTTDVNAANAANLSAQGATTTANKAALAAHAADLAAHARETLDHAQATQSFEAAKAARDTLDTRENINWMRRALNKVGLGAQTPRTVGDRELNTVRNLIGNKLNEANAQLHFDPNTTDAIQQIQNIRDRVVFRNEDNERYWKNLIDNKVLNTIGDKQPVQPGLTALPGPTKPIARWLPKAPLQGADFAKYVTMLNQEADNLARNAKFPGRDTADDLEMADALHAMVDFVEGSAKGTPEALAARDAAREGYRIYSTLRMSADPTKLSIATPEQVVAQTVRRAGNAERYGNKLANPNAPGHVDVARANQWLKQSKAPEPQPPPPLRPAPKPPKLAAAPKPGPVPTPPAPPPPSRASEIGKAVGRHALAALAGREVGLPLGAANLLLETARIAGKSLPKGGVPSKATQAARGAVRSLARRPGVTGSAAGNAPLPDIDILSIVPGGPDGQNR